MKQLIALRKTSPLAPTTRLHVDPMLYGSMLGYTLATPTATGYRCRTIVVNMGPTGGWSVPLAHRGPECSAAPANEAYSDHAHRLASGSYSIEPYAKVVLDGTTSP